MRAPTVAGRTRHPAWCDPNACRTLAEDTEHRSAPVGMVTTEELWEARFVRVDEHKFPNDPGNVHLSVTVTSLGLEVPPTQHLVPVDDLPQLAAWLLAHYSRAMFGPTREVLR